MKLFLKQLAIALVALAVVGGGSLAWRLWPERHRFFTDADTIRQPIDAAEPRDILWQPPVVLSEQINTPEHDYEPRISADGLTLYFVRGKAGENTDILYATRTLDGWTEPAPLEGVNTEYDELGPIPSRDGTALYFYTDRPGGMGGYDVWVARRSRDGWLAATNLGPAVNSEFNDYGPALSPDDKTLYFASNRPRPIQELPLDDSARWSATLREDLIHRTYDLYVCELTDAGPVEARALVELNTLHNEGAPSVSPVGDFLYFSSDRPGGEGGYDLYRSRLLRGTHQPAENLGPPVNLASNELDASLAMGGYGLYFSSDRSQEEGDASEANYNLYYSASREVFADSETTSNPINWAAFWRNVLPNLLWALLALLLLLLLLALMRDMRGRRLSLLARCLLASLAAHMLLLLLFTLWQVAGSLSNREHGKGSIQVALLSSATGSEITTQIRGNLTTVDAPTPTEVETQRASVESTPVKLSSPHVSLEADHRPVTFPDRPVTNATVADSSPPASTSTPAPNAQVQDLPQRTIDHNVRLDSPRIAEQESARPLPDAQRVAESKRRADDYAPSAQQQQSAQVALEPAMARTSQPSNERQTMVTPPSADDARTGEQPQVVSNLAVTRNDARESKRDLPPIRVPDERQVDASVEHTPASPQAVVAPQRTAPAVSRVSNAPAQTMASVQLAPAEANPSLARSNKSLSVDPQPNDARPAMIAEALPTSNPTNAAASAPQLALEVALPASDGVAEPAQVSEAEAQAEYSPAAQSPAARRDYSRRRSLNSMAVPSFAEFAPTEEVASPDRDASLAASLPHEDSDMTRPTQLALRTTELPLPSMPAESSLMLNLPTELAPHENPFAHREQKEREQLVERLGGSRETEESVAIALAWLARHQSDDGRWDGEYFDESCGKCGGQTREEIDAGLTGLALMCFLAADHTHIADGPYRATVDRGLRWLVDKQDPDGGLRLTAETMYSHGIATIALAEAYAMTGDSWLRLPVEKAIRFIERARNTQVGGWRYDPGQPGDTSVLGWQVMAMKSASQAGITVDPAALRGAADWMTRVTPRADSGRYAYRPGEPPSRPMTAEGMFIHQLLGVPRDDARMERSIRFILEDLPDWQRPNTYFWYYATLALHQHQGEPWRVWNERLTEVLLENQHKHGLQSGSWDPVGQWAHIGGRVYQTALCTLMLEVYYRYLPQYLDELPADSIGVVRGTVRDIATREPIVDATVRLDLPDARQVNALTREDGTYELHIPDVPDHFAISASAGGYVPESVNIGRANVEVGTVHCDFDLRLEGIDVIAIEAEPEVHHLGDDAFGGRINSQFQKSAEGDRYSAQFELSAEQLRGRSKARLHMMCKGVQMKHELRINGETLDSRLDNSPRDGSFGPFVVQFDAALLRAGANRFDLLASSRGTDVDDFEFVNVQIHLAE